jgi:hypothetical protein
MAFVTELAAPSSSYPMPCPRSLPSQRAAIDTMLRRVLIVAQGAHPRPHANAG